MRSCETIRSVAAQFGNLCKERDFGMAVVKIGTITLSTIGGHTAHIDGIELTGHDLFVGMLVTDGALGGVGPSRWNASGIRRDDDGSGNISVRDLADLLESARKLNASGTS